ncbi:MAG: IS3 family transposase [Chloroflexi bacterium]|nr:IS3 family transposase [Chloroflexota bacterium]
MSKKTLAPPGQRAAGAGERSAAVSALAPQTGVAAACRALGVSRASYYRHSPEARPVTALPSPLPRPRPARALTDAERAAVLDQLHSDRFVDQAPAEVYATLLDEGVYRCSERTMYRILAQAAEVHARRAQARHPVHLLPVLVAERPNQVWSWDLTKLAGPAKGSWFSLDTIIDSSSRSVPGWLVATREHADLARRFIAETAAKHAIAPDTLTLHADRGSPMVAQSVALRLGSLGIAPSHSRPHVSNDNPFSESGFKTLKYHPTFPQRCGSLEDARTFGQQFFTWYHTAQQHQGIGLHTPVQVHTGAAAAVRAQRLQTLQVAYAHHPERFMHGAPQPPALPSVVWINRPIPHDQEAPMLL